MIELMCDNNLIDSIIYLSEETFKTKIVLVLVLCYGIKKCCA